MAIEKQDIEKEVTMIIAEKLTIDSKIITIQSTLQDLGADSLDMVEIIMKIEEHFNIEIDDDEAEKLMNVHDVIEYVHRLRVK